MNYKVGDRVRSLLNDYPGLSADECGTIVKLRKANTPVIEWDKFNRERHDCGGLVTNGHGWYVYSNSHIELIHQCEDLGDICDTHMDVSKFLFDT